MKGFETLEHPADLKIRAFGKNKKELFLNTMVGMYTGARKSKEKFKFPLLIPPLYWLIF